MQSEQGLGAVDPKPNAFCDPARTAGRTRVPTMGGTKVLREIDLSTQSATSAGTMSNESAPNNPCSGPKTDPYP